MGDNNQFFEEILLELSYRSDEGYPDFSKPQHITILSEILTDWGLTDVKYELIKNLLKEDEEKPLDDKEKEKAKQLKLVWKGKGYGKEGEEGITYKNVDGKLTKIDKDDKEKTEKPKTKVGGAADFQHSPDIRKQTKGKGERNISQDNLSITNDFKSRVEERVDSLTDNQKEIVKDSLDKIDIIYDDDSTTEEKTQAAQWLVDNAGFSTNANKQKAYFNKLGGNRKIISGDAGTKKSADLVSKVSELVDLKEFDAKGVKQGFTTAAKPDLGNDNIIKPSDSPKVKQYFSSHPVLKKIRPGLHGLFGVKGEDGKVKMPSNLHSKEYLEQSINNPALSNTINYAKEQVESGGVDKGVLTGLESHQSRMQSILEKEEIPSEKAAQAIADSYNDLMIDLHKADADVANAILKQIAENNLYEQELAKGEEVYLPSAGNFPAGDKIKGGSLERVSLVSCKWGKVGRIYGCPANSKTICELHPNKEKQNNQGQYLGQDGYTLLINDNLIKDDTKPKTVAKTSKFIKDTLTEVGLNEVFSDDEVDKISNIVADYMEEIDKIKKEVADSNPADKTAYWKAFGQQLSKVEDKYKKSLGSLITSEHASKLIGENNAPNLVQKGGVKVESLLSAIEIANNIRTNTTLNELEHNKQYYDENGEPKFVTDTGTQNPNDYSITFRTKRTAGRTGGGCQLSFTGDGEVGNIDLNDDGVAVDNKSGEELEV